jgi:hypothetical protein
MVASMDGGMVAQQREANRLLARYEAIRERRAQGPPFSRDTAASRGQAAAAEDSTPAAKPLGSVGNDPTRGHQPLVASPTVSTTLEKSSVASHTQVTEPLRRALERAERLQSRETSGPDQRSLKLGQQAEVETEKRARDRSERDL